MVQVTGIDHGTKPTTIQDRLLGDLAFTIIHGLDGATALVSVMAGSPSVGILTQAAGGAPAVTGMDTGMDITADTDMGTGTDTDMGMQLVEEQVMWQAIVLVHGRQGKAIYTEIGLQEYGIRVQDLLPGQGLLQLLTGQQPGLQPDLRPGLPILPLAVDPLHNLRNQDLEKTIYIQTGVAMCIKEMEMEHGNNETMANGTSQVQNRAI